MKLTGPVITLIAGAGLAGALLVANLNATHSVSGPASAVAPVTQASAAVSTRSSAPSTASAAGTVTPQASATTTTPAVRRGTYVGHVSGAGRMALVVRDGVAIAYLCDGKTIEAWLQGTATAGTLKLTGRKGAGLVGSFDRGHAAGTVVTGGVSRNFDIAWVTKPSGLYKAAARLRGATVQAGWIVLPDGTQVGVVTTDGSTPQAAPPLDVASTSATVDGTTVTAVPVDSDTGTGF